MSNKTIFFLTFHKAASSFFSKYVLKHIDGYDHVDYASEMFNGRVKDKVSFKDVGVVYGPIRMSINADPMNSRLFIPLLKSNLLNECRLICLVRDPRAILVSYFYSEAYSHVISKVEKIKEVQLRNRQNALLLGIDKYVLSRMNFIMERFNILKKILETNDDNVLLQFEEMIGDFDTFYEKLHNFAPLERGVYRHMYEATRPINNSQNDLLTHRRDGSADNYKNEVHPETLRLMTDRMSMILKSFGYEG